MICVPSMRPISRKLFFPEEWEEMFDSVILLRESPDQLTKINRNG